MKFHQKRIRRLRRLALAGCLIAAIAPASASAMLPDRGPDRVQPQSQQYNLPSNFRTEVQTAAPQSQQYNLPSNFRTEVQTAAPQSTTVHAFVLHRGFRPEVQTSTPAVASNPGPSIVRQIETVNDNSGRTLAIVLASVALAIALASLCYASIRIARVSRRELGSH
jgi:hypothetical protein